MSTKLSGTCMWYSRRPLFHQHYHYLNSYTDFLLLIESILNSPLLIVLCLHNYHPTWLVSCIFQISIGSSDHPFHNLLFLKLNLTWANVLFRSLRLEQTRHHFENIATFRKTSSYIYSKLHFHHRSSVLPRSDNDFCASWFMIMQMIMFFAPLSSCSENISVIELYH